MFDFDRIKYLEWIKQSLLEVKYDLASSGVRPVSREEFSVNPSRIELHGNQFEGTSELRELLAARLRVPVKNLFLCEGASMGIALCAFALIRQGEEVLLEVPNYEPLYRIPVALEANIKILDRLFEKRFQVDMEAFERRISRSTRVVLLTNCHNPSGVAISPEKLQAIGQIAKAHGAKVVCCEVYRELMFGGSLPPAFHFGDHMVSIGSLSKSYGLPGIRLGWVVAEEKLVDTLRRLRNYFTNYIAFPTQSIAVQALEQADPLLDRSKRIAQKGMEILGSWIADRDDLAWVPPDGGTICFVKLLGGIDSLHLSNHLKQKYSTLVVPGDFFWAKGYMRIGFGIDEAVLQTGLRNLGAALDELRRIRHVYS